MRLRVLGLAVLALSGACRGTVHMAQASGFYDVGDGADRSVITSSAEQHTIMGVVEDTLYVDAAWSSLQRQCSRGSIDGITVETSTQLGFFQWTNRVSMRGICVTRPAPAPVVPEADEESEEADPGSSDPR